MSSGHLVREAPPSAHRCSLPRNEFRDADTGERVTYPIPPAALTGVTERAPQRDVVFWPGVGAVWQCDACGTVWMSYWDPGFDGRHISECGSVKWRREKRREARKRLKDGTV